MSSSAAHLNLASREIEENAPSTIEVTAVTHVHYHSGKDLNGVILPDQFPDFACMDDFNLPYLYKLLLHVVALLPFYTPYQTFVAFRPLYILHSLEVRSQTLC